MPKKKKPISFPSRQYRAQRDSSQVINGGNPQGVGGGRSGQRDYLPKSIKPRHLDEATGTGQISFNVDGGGSAITTGEKGHLRIEFDCDITRATALVDTGTITVDVWKSTLAKFPDEPTDTQSITGNSPFNITSNQKYENAGLDDWNVKISKGDVLAFNVDLVSSATRCSLTLQVRKR